VITGKAQTKYRRRKTYLLGGLSNEVKFRVYEDSMTASLRMILERVYFVKSEGVYHEPYLPEPNTWTTKTLKFENLCKSRIRFTTPMTLDEFWGSYSGRKQTIYRNAVESLGIRPVVRKDSYLSSFMKVEKYNFTAKKDPVPRVIQPRSPRYNAAVGRYLRPIEKRLYKIIDFIFDQQTVAKGLNALDRGKLIADKWQRHKDCVAVGIDASRFDQHVSVDALKFEHRIYDMFYNSPELRNLLKWQLQNKGFVRGQGYDIKYEVPGRRTSGDMNTAMGNVLIMCAIVWTYMEERGIDYSFIDDGDDGVIFVGKNDLTKLDHLPQHFKEFGFKLTVEEPVYTLEKTVFCQAQPVFDGSQYRMVRDPRVAIAKDCLSIKPLDNRKIYKSWCAAVGEGGLSLTGGIPVWQDFYRTIHEYSDGSKRLNDPSMETGLVMLAKGMNEKYREIDAVTRYSFWLAFGITPGEQMACEEYYRSVDVSYGKAEEIPDTVRLPGL